jgi:hypothetical protein
MKRTSDKQKYKEKDNKQLQNLCNDLLAIKLLQIES